MFAQAAKISHSGFSVPTWAGGPSRLVLERPACRQQLHDWGTCWPLKELPEGFQPAASADKRSTSAPYIEPSHQSGHEPLDEPACDLHRKNSQLGNLVPKCALNLTPLSLLDGEDVEVI